MARGQMLAAELQAGCERGPPWTAEEPPIERNETTVAPLAFIDFWPFAALPDTEVQVRVPPNNRFQSDAPRAARA